MQVEILPMEFWKFNLMAKSSCKQTVAIIIVTSIYVYSMWRVLLLSFIEMLFLCTLYSRKIKYRFDVWCFEIVMFTGPKIVNNYINNDNLGRSLFMGQINVYHMTTPCAYSTLFCLYFEPCFIQFQSKLTTLWSLECLDTLWGHRLWQCSLPWVAASKVL